MRMHVPALLLLAGLCGEAVASVPAPVFCDPRKVELLPNDAGATRVVIHGTFTRRLDTGGYGVPVCGYMHFECRTGQEAMCRMQWKELRDQWVGKSECAGFGQQNTVSDARVYPEGTPLGTPDKWDLGMGLVPGYFLPDSRCPQAKELKCPAPQVPDLAEPPAVDMRTTAPPQDPPPTKTSGCAMGVASDAAPALPGLLLLLGLCRRRSGGRAC